MTPTDRGPAAGTAATQQTRPCSTITCDTAIGGALLIKETARVMKGTARLCIFVCLIVRVRDRFCLFSLVFDVAARSGIGCVVGCMLNCAAAEAK